MIKILIVDDQKVLLDAFTNYLKKEADFKIVGSITVAEAADIACDRFRPDLVLMDVVLPGMNGFQATRMIARDQTTGHIPVLIISTKGMETDIAWGLRQGAKDYLVKPPRESELLARIDSLLGSAAR